MLAAGAILATSAVTQCRRSFAFLFSLYFFRNVAMFFFRVSLENSSLFSLGRIRYATLIDGQTRKVRAQISAHRKG